MDPTYLNQDFLLQSLAQLVNEEGQRIINAEIEDQDMVRSYISTHIDKNDLMKSLSNLHTKLSAIKLAEDKERFYEAPKTTYTGEPFYILPEKTEAEEEMQEELERFIAEEEDEEIKQLSSIVCDTLSKIASYVGAQGNHEAAYLIERTILKWRDNYA
jgi:hypothetical protein